MGIWDIPVQYSGDTYAFPYHILFQLNRQVKGRQSLSVRAGTSIRSTAPHKHARVHDPWKYWMFHEHQTKIGLHTDKLIAV
jgi:hypothetical protein